ncbi:MAG: hypothetical protein ACYSWP_17175, partial [Planctomycetota bacterium]
YLAHYQRANSALPVNILSDPFITDTSLPLCVDNEKVIVLVPAAGKNIKAILINPTEKDQKIRLKSILGTEADPVEFVDSKNGKFSCQKPVIIPKMDFIKVVSKNG